MTTASTRARSKADTRSERLQPWIAALLSVLLHVLLLLILLHEKPPTFAQSESAAPGGRMKVQFIGRSTDPATRTPPSPPPSRATTPPSKPTPKKPTVQRKPATSPVQTTLVEQAADPVPDESAAIPTTTADDSWSMPSPSQRVTQQQTKPPGNPPPSPERAATWGRPPGMLDRDTAPTEDGLSDSASTNRGNRRDSGANGPSLEIGGYHAYYETRSEARVRAWMDQGMKEFFIPLPGTQYLMVCELEIVLKSGSGKCRALPPDSPELKGIGDAREIINMLRVYKQGELLWQGPGPYR